MAFRLRTERAEVSMPRAVRYSPPDSVHHVINRGNDRRCLFASPNDFAEFLDLLAWAKAQCPMRVVAYCLMPNHWHLVLWPEEANAMAAFLHRLCTTHSIRWRKSTGTVGEGHVYQHRYHAFLIESEAYYFRVLKYVEMNPLRAGLVGSAAEWPWSSLAERRGTERGILDPGPLPLPTNWGELVEQATPPAELEDIHRRLRRHAPIAPRRGRGAANSARISV
jgi:putative transposase